MRKRVVTLYSGKEGDEPSPEKPPPGSGRPNKKLETSAQVEEVARGMFASMCSGLDSEVITEENLHEAIQNLADDSINPTQSLVITQEYALSSKDIKSSIEKLLQSILKGTNGREVTCDLFCEAAVRHAEGKISIFDRLENNVAAADAKMPEHANLETLMYHPVHTLMLMKRGVLKIVEKQGSKWVWSFFSTKHLYWFLAVYFVPMMTAQVIVSSVSTALFNATMLFLLTITIQTAIDLEKLQSRISYLSLFQYFNKAGTQIPMPTPKKSDMAPYITFIGGLVVGVVFLGFSHHSFVYYELLGIISMVMAFLVMLQFDLYESPLFWVYVLAKAPSWVMVGLDMTCALIPFLSSSPLTFLRNPLLTLSLFEGFDFDVNIITLLQCASHLCLLVYTIKYVKFTYSSLGHHFLFFGWFVLCRHFISSSSPFHLVLILTSPLAFPFYSIGFLISPLYFLYFYGFAPPFFYSIASIGIVVVLAVFVMASVKIKRIWWMNISIEYIILLFMGFCVFLMMFLSAWYTSLYQVAQPLPTVSVGEYRQYCGPENWVDGNMVQAQINCMHLKNRLFRSDADVKSVGIAKAQDTMATSISFLPKFLERALACHLGKFEAMCGDRTDDSTCINTGCHFQHSLTYTFKIELEIPIEEVKTTLLVSHHHMEFVSKLKSGTSLQFDATFVDGMGSDHLTLQAVSLSAFGLADTQNLDRERNEDMKKSLMSVFFRSVKNSFIVLLEIFFGYAT